MTDPKREREIDSRVFGVYATHRKVPVDRWMAKAAERLVEEIEEELGEGRAGPD